MALNFQPGSLASLLQKPPMGGLQMPQQQTPNLQMPMPPLPPEQPQGRKIGLAEIMGILGDAMQTAGGGQGTFAPFVAGQRDKADAERMLREKLAAETQQRARDRQAKIEDAIKLRQFDAENPGPTSLQRDYDFFRQQPGNEGMSIGQFMDMYRPQMVLTPDGPAMMQRGAQPAPPPGLVPLTPEEIAQLGLPEGGPTGERSGGFR